MKTGQPAAGLLGVHRLGDFGSDVLKSALSIKADSRFLNLGGAHYHPGKSERTRFCLRMIEHALRDAFAAITLIEVHAAKFGVADAVALNTKRTDDFVAVLDHPEGVALCLGKDLEKLLEFTVDGRRDVTLEHLLHSVRRECSIDARPQCGDRIVIRSLIAAEGDRICLSNHGFLNLQSDPKHTFCRAPDQAAAGRRPPAL
jgi:hypothetical protein